MRNPLLTTTTVLVLLSVSGGLIELTDDEGRSARNDLHLCHDESTITHYSSLTIHDSQLDRDLQTLPIHGGLLDIVTDLLRGLSRHTEHAALPFREDRP